MPEVTISLHVDLPNQPHEVRNKLSWFLHELTQLPAVLFDDEKHRFAKALLQASLTAEVVYPAQELTRAEQMKMSLETKASSWVDLLVAAETTAESSETDYENEELRFTMYDGSTAVFNLQHTSIVAYKPS